MEFNPSWTIQGELDVILKDYDGTQRFDFTESWVLEREMTIDVERLMDEQGPFSKPCPRILSSWVATPST